jgi:hypothetical protein
LVSYPSACLHRPAGPLRSAARRPGNARSFIKPPPCAKLAFQLLEFIAHPKPQADFINILPYGPPHRKAFGFISKETARKMPANPDNLRVSCVLDANWARDMT